jgi:predicted O-methyltransferase YrrM
MRSDLAKIEILPRLDVDDPEESADLALVDATEGWLSLAEARALRSLARAVGAGRSIVEVGSYRGRSAVALALGARRGSGATVYAVDPHAPFLGARGGRFGPQDRAAFYANVSRAGVGEHVALVGLPSSVAARGWTRSDVGLLFLDGDHRYEAVRADFESWAPHLSEGAIVAFDDCDYPDIARLIGELESVGRVRAIAGEGKVRWFAAGS